MASVIKALASSVFNAFPEQEETSDPNPVNRSEN
jgi:hypothetical protein